MAFSGWFLVPLTYVMFLDLVFGWLLGFLTDWPLLFGLTAVLPNLTLIASIFATLFLFGIG